MTIRFAEPQDAAALAAIYAQSIPTTVTFETQAPSAAEFEQRIRTISEKYPYFVAAKGDKILGYAYAHAFYIERPAYAKSVECSIYLDRSAQRRGLGKALYSALERELLCRGFHSLYAVITAENLGSRRFHEACGFRLAGRLHQAGNKGGRWLDVVFYEKILADGK